MTPLGLGDLAYYLFRPAVYAIDWTWGTDLRDCDKCKARRVLWNSWFSMPLWLWTSLFVTTLFFVVWWRK